MTLVASHLHVRLGGRLLLDDVSLELRQGTVTVILGENGAGKSTLLDVLVGLRQPEAGTVFVGGQDLSGLPTPERAQRIASLGQEDVAPEGLAVAARIGQGLAARRGPSQLLDEGTLERIGSLARDLHVERLLSRDLATLSGGERRRVHLARALLDDQAAVVLLDEPHAGVDLRHQPAVDDAIRARARAGAAVALTAHDLAVAQTLADRVVALREGKLVAAGEAIDVLTPATLEGIFGVPFAELPALRPR